MKAPITIRKALEDPALLGNVLKGESWAPWRVMLIAMMGEKLYEEERGIFARLTGRNREPGAPVENLLQWWAGGAASHARCRHLRHTSLVSALIRNS
jgi:hypothetical protein